MSYHEREIERTYKAILDVVHGKNAMLALDAMTIALAKAYVLCGGTDKTGFIETTAKRLNGLVDIEMEWKRKNG